MSIRTKLTTIAARLERKGRVRRPLVWLVQTGIFVGSGFLAFLLRFDLTLPPREMPHLLLALPIWIVVKAVVFRRAKLDAGWWSLISIFDVIRLAGVNVAASALSAIPVWLSAGRAFPRSVYVLDFLVCFLATAGVRIIFRILTEAFRESREGSSAKRAIVYGAGKAGVMLLRELRAGSELPYFVCAFVDDDPGKQNTSIQGVPVVGVGKQLAAMVRKHKADEILIAMPSATGPEMTQILSHCHDAAVPYKMVPSLSEIMKERGLAKQIRNVAVEDLLGRSPVHLDIPQISGKLGGRVVVVTGAGGSIGSELCRQIAEFAPAAIVGFDTSENALYHLDLEMKERFPKVPFHAEIGSIQNGARVAEIFERHRPAVLYHAAAFKHVPFLESHVVEAVENNILGTATVARLAGEFGLEDFVMISTDKAVRPASLLGVSKRVAELVVKSFESGSIKYVSVRFGNVLGSNGSVIPRFKKQIAAGGPVTVTHPAMQRYFMTIPEAAQLVLQASAMGTGGEVFVLDMGLPMKILDLARNLIILSGLRPEQDIPIVFTGLRPGEKLFEELTSSDELAEPTRHEKIQVFRGDSIGPREMARHLEVLRSLCDARDAGGLILTLKDIVPDYNPSAQLLRQMLQARASTASLAALATNVGFSQGAPVTEVAPLLPRPSRVLS